MSKVLSVRVDDAVAARVEELAAGRSIKAGVWLKEAVASYLDDHERGVPDAPAPVAEPEPVAEAVAPPSRPVSTNPRSALASRWGTPEQVAAGREASERLAKARAEQEQRVAGMRKRMGGGS